VVKNVTGFDLAKLYTGSFGCLGVIESAWLRLRPSPESVAACIAPLRADADGVRLAIETARRPTARCAALLDPEWAESIGLGRDAAVLLVELAGTAPGVQGDLEWLGRQADATPAPADAIDALARAQVAAPPSGGARARLAMLPSSCARAASSLRESGARLAVHAGLGLVHADWDVAGEAIGAVARVAAAVGAEARFEHLSDELKRGRDVFGVGADRSAVIERARAAGVTHVVVMGENEAENHRILAASRLDPFLLPAAGHYPANLDPEMAARTETFIREHREELAAVGEVGVDHRITEDPADHAVQDEILRRLAGVAAELDLPISVHSRSAGRHAIEVLRSTAATRVVMHAFDGKYGSAVSGLDAGYHFSVPPSVVRSRQKQKLVTQLPLDRLLLESDAPVLGPDPAARNEPANLRLAAERIAELKRVSLERVLEAVSENTRRVFPCLPGTGSHSPSEAR